MPTPDKYHLFDRIEAQFEGALGCTEWYKGSVIGVRESGTYDVEYDDGDTEVDVPSIYIRLLDATLTSRESELIRRNVLHAELDEKGLLDHDHSGVEMALLSCPTLGREVVSKRIQICASGDEWIFGVVLAYTKATGKHEIVFGKDHSRCELDLKVIEKVRIEK